MDETPPSIATHALTAAALPAAALALSILLAAAAPASAAPSQPGHREALVIGNDLYEHARPLANPGNDAVAMAVLLRRLGFHVTLRTDADLRRMREGLREFVDRLPSEPAPDSVALVYFAGHGVQIAGQNYLVPVDAKMARDFEVPDETLSMDAVMRALESAGAGLNLLILDCCRNNPFARSWRGARSVDTGGGLAMPTTAPQGMFVAFSTSPNDVADDGEGDHSPYTAALLAHLPTPGKPFEEVFKAVGGDVVRKTGGTQEPWFNSKFYGSFRFVEEGAPLPGLAEQPHEATRDRPWANRLGLEFLPVPGRPGVLMARTPVRVRDFRAYAEATGYRQSGGAHLFGVAEKEEGGYTTEWTHRADASWEKPGYEQGPDHPVVCVDWDEAAAFCRWLSEQEGLRYRLPSDAEWTAAVGNSLHPWGEAWPPPPGAGNFWDLAAIRELPGDWTRSVIGGSGFDDGAARTSRVASYQPNAHGFHDLAGNVWEWLADDYDPAMNPADLLETMPSLRKRLDDKGRPYKVLRGGGWSDFNPARLRSDFRDFDERDRRDDDYGFRVVLELPDAVAE